MLRDMVPHGVHMVHAWMTEIKSKVEGIVVVTTRHKVQ